MTVQSKLIEIIRMQQDEIEELRKENQFQRERLEEMAYTFIPKTMDPVYTDKPYQPNMPAPTYPYTIPDQPHYTPVTVGNNCATCGINVTGAVGYVCSRPKCPVGLSYALNT
jgi:hypothetical protein